MILHTLLLLVFKTVESFQGTPIKGPNPRDWD